MDIQTVKRDDLVILGKHKKSFCTTSRIIADALEKQHKNVLQKIEELLTNIEENSYIDNGLKVKLVKQFHKRTYINEQNKEQPEYYIK